MFLETIWRSIKVRSICFDARVNIPLSFSFPLSLASAGDPPSIFNESVGEVGSMHLASSSAPPSARLKWGTGFSNRAKKIKTSRIGIIWYEISECSCVKICPNERQTKLDFSVFYM